MSSNLQKNCNEFNAEIWLYLSGELHHKRTMLWSHHIESCDNCKALLNESKKIFEEYEKIPLDDLSDNRLNDFIGTATKEKPGDDQVKHKIPAKKGKSLVELFGFYRLTFGGAAVSAAIILLLIMFLKDPETEIKNVIPKKILDWEGSNIVNRIEKVEDKILSLQTDEWDIYVVRKNQKENWKTTLNNIRKQIVKIKSESGTKKF